MRTDGAEEEGEGETVDAGLYLDSNGPHPINNFGCTICHGADLRGLGTVPGIAGRSPSYLARQMYDIQVGTRHGEWSELMKPVVAKLTNEDFVAIAAYVSSRPMPPAPGNRIQTAEAR